MLTERDELHELLDVPVSRLPLGDRVLFFNDVVWVPAGDRVEHLGTELVERRGWSWDDVDRFKKHYVPKFDLRSSLQLGIYTSLSRDWLTPLHNASTERGQGPGRWAHFATGSAQPERLLEAATRRLAEAYYLQEALAGRITGWLPR